MLSLTSVTELYTALHHVLILQVDVTLNFYFTSHYEMIIAAFYPEILVLPKSRQNSALGLSTHRLVVRRDGLRGAHFQ